MTDAELNEFVGQIDDIINHIQAVQKMTVDNTEPTSHPSSLSGMTREDVIKPTLAAERALDQTPSQDRQRFEVPQTLGEQECVGEITAVNPNLYVAVAEDSILGLSAFEFAQKIHARELTSVEVTQVFLNRIVVTNEDIHTLLHVDVGGALATIRRVDESPDVGEKPAPTLAGVPLTLRDALVTTDVPTICVPEMLEGYMGPYDATVTARLCTAGIPILGKANIDEFTMGSPTESSAYGPTHNPWNVERTADGSGGSSSAALASGMALLAIGTDTGGLIHRPVALIATVDVRPTYGTVSRYGLVACASSLDQGGLTARTVLDTTLLHEIIASHDENDSTSAEQPAADVVAVAKKGAIGDLTGVKVGIVKQFDCIEGYQANVPDNFHEAVGRLEEAGTEVVEVDRPNFDHALSTYYLILPCRASSNLARFGGMRYDQRIGDDGMHSTDEVMAMVRAAGFGDEVKRHIIIGTYAPSVGYYDAYYTQAQRVRTLIQQDLERALEKVDVLILPTTPTTAFKLSKKVDDSLSMYMFYLCTLSLDLAGMRGMSIPSGLAEDTGLPVDLQIMVPRHGNNRPYKVDVAYEKIRSPIA